jgi:hypothetical protein
MRHGEPCLVVSREFPSRADVHTRMHRRNLAVLGVVMLSGPAFAQSEPSGPDQLTMPKRKLLVDAFVELNLSKDTAFEPVSIAPDVWYGATDDLTLGLVHSSIGATGVIGGVGDALCITGSSNGCESVYPGVGIDARYRLKGGWAIDGGLFVNDFDPFALAIKLGLVGRHRISEKLAFEAQPNVFIGLTERDATADGMGVVTYAGNEEILSVPVTAAYLAAPKITLSGQLALQTPFSEAGDNWSLGLSIGGRYRASDHLDLGLAFSLPLLAGGGDGTGADARSITLGVGYAL